MSTAANAAVGAGSGGGSAAPPADFASFANETLGIEPVNFNAPAEEAPAEKTGAADAAAVDTKAAGGQSDSAAAEAAKPAVDEWAIDQALVDKALADPNYGAIVKTLMEQRQRALAWKEHWATPEEAKEARALAPGGLEELKGYVERAKTAQTEQADFASGVPERQKVALESIANEMPEQFAASLPVYMDMVQSKNPEAYQKHMQAELRRTLEVEGTPEIIKGLLSAADGDPDDPKVQRAFETAFGQVREWAEKMGFAGKAEGTKPAAKPALDPETAAKLKKLETLEAGEKKAAANAAGDWLGKMSTSVEEEIGKEITARLEGVLPKNVPKEYREMTLGMSREKISAEVRSQLLADVNHQQKLFEVINGKWQKDPEGVRQQCVNLNLGRAKQILPYVVERVMKTTTQATVAAAAEKTAAETGAAKKPDITGTNAGRSGKVNFGVKDIRSGGALAGKSDAEILDL
jgi:hypothetical protein